jgi:hypothetical protein
LENGFDGEGYEPGERGTKTTSGSFVVVGEGYDWDAMDV